MEKLIKSDNGQWTLVKADDKADANKGQQPPPIMLTDRAERKDQAQSVVPEKPTKGNKVREKGAGYKMTRGVGDMMQQLHEEGQMQESKLPGAKMKAHMKEANKVARMPVEGDFNQKEKIRELKDQARRTIEAASRSKYFTKPEKEDKVIRRKKEDMAKALDGMIYNLNKALEEDHDSEMLFSQLEAIMHHIKEIREVMTPEEDAPDWVDAKITEAAKQLSDVAHYIQGEKAAKK